MFPLWDTTPRRRFPFVNYLLIAINIYVFILQLAAPNFDQFVNTYGFVPSHFNFLSPISYLPILTSLFIHGGFFHILSNMWFLRVFGDNVEDRMGHIPYLLFYLLAGFVATMGQYLFTMNSTIVQIGASGGISGVIGAYFVLFKNSRVKTLVFLFIFVTLVDLPASFVLGYWFLSQVFAGLGSLTTVDVNQGGIAFFAHVSGFVFGYLTARRLNST